MASLFVKGRCVLSNFWHLNCYSFCYILKKKVVHFRSLTQVSENTLKITFIGPPIAEKRSFKKLKILSFLAPFILKIKTTDIFNFLSVKYFGKGLLFLKIWLDNTFFWKLTPKQVFGESFMFFDPPTRKWWSFKFFAKLKGNHILMANFSKFGKYQTFVLTDLHNLSKFQLADRIFKLWKGCVYEYLRIPTFKQLCQNFYEKISRFLNRLWKYW